MSKNFKNNPALRFMGESQPEEREQRQNKGEERQASVKQVQSPQAEPINRRVQLLMKPSIHQAAIKKANSQGLKFGEYIRLLVERDLQS